MKVTTIGIDLAKDVFGLHGVDGEGRVTFKRRLVRSRLLEFLSQLPRCLVGLEACSSAHYWAHEIERLGHRVRLMSPRFVKPYRKSDKNDANDAEAICEAVTRASMRFVPIKSEAQHEVQALHRVREQLLKSRTALVNQVRDLLAEHGVVATHGIARARRLLLGILAAKPCKKWPSGCASSANGSVPTMTGSSECLKRMSAVEGSPRSKGWVRWLLPRWWQRSATRVNSRAGSELSAWLGLVPRQHSSGNRSQLLGISKRGDRYLRTILIHGARAALRRADHKRDQRSRWAMRIKLARGYNKAAVALANKNARIIWALLTRGENYRPAAISVASAGSVESV